MAKSWKIYFLHLLLDIFHKFKSNTVAASPTIM